MTVKFKNKEMSDITFLSLPNAHFYPPQLLTSDLSYLSDFMWQNEKRPLLKMFKEIQNKYGNTVVNNELNVDNLESNEFSETQEEEVSKNKKVKKGFLKKKNLK